jgi:hypothetical protein
MSNGLASEDDCQQLMLHVYVCLFVFLPLQPTAVVSSQPGSGLLSPYDRGFFITNDAPHSVGLLWTSNQSFAETSTRKHTTFTTDKSPCPRWDSNPESQQASGLRPTLYTTRPLRPAFLLVGLLKLY